MNAIPELYAGLLDDAAIFPPGNASLADAVVAHLKHERSVYAALVGPLVISAQALTELPSVLRELAGAGESLPPAGLRLSVTCPAPAAIPGVWAGVSAITGVTLVALEVALPADLPADRVRPTIDDALAAPPSAGGEAPEVFVEVPRDGRRLAILDALAASAYQAKLRTGGVTAELYPDREELAAAVRACVQLGLPFKATAGLHHAIRNIDPSTGFDQHGFCNLMVATAAALDGEDVAALAALLGERDGARLAARLAALPEEAARALRTSFASFGTCSIAEPRDELMALGLLPELSALSALATPPAGDGPPAIPTPHDNPRGEFA